MQKALGMLLVMLGSAACCVAGTAVPEIDPSAGVAGLGLVAGGLVIIRARRKK